MAAILITGRTELFSQKALENLSKQYRVIVTARDHNFSADRDVRFYDTLPTEEKFLSVILYFFFKLSEKFVFILVNTVDGTNSSHSTDICTTYFQNISFAVFIILLLISSPALYIGIVAFTPCVGFHSCVFSSQYHHISSYACV